MSDVQRDVIMAVLFGWKSSPAMAAGLAAVPDRIARLDASFHETAVTLLASLTALGFKGGAACGIPTARLFVGLVPSGHSVCAIGIGAQRFSPARDSKRSVLWCSSGRLTRNFYAQIHGTIAHHEGSVVLGEANFSPGSSVVHVRLHDGHW